VGADAEDLYKNLLKPMMKVGNDFISEVSSIRGDVQ
jgi:hypothetical protein